MSSPSKPRFVTKRSGAKKKPAAKEPGAGAPRPGSPASSLAGVARLASETWVRRSSPESKNSPSVRRSSPESKNSPSADVLLHVPTETTEDRILLEIRKFIASAIFFNSQAAEKVGLSLTDSQMIHTLQLYGPSTPTRLAAATGLSSGGVTVALDRLEKGGYIRREPNPADRRSLLVHINPARLLKLKGIYENVEAETRRCLSTLPRGDLAAVIRFFEALSAVRTNRTP